MPWLASGCPVVFLLDGNAALAAIDDNMLGRLTAGAAAPVLVAAGHQTDRRFEAEGLPARFPPWSRVCWLSSAQASLQILAGRGTS